MHEKALTSYRKSYTPIIINHFPISLCNIILCERHNNKMKRTQTVNWRMGRQMLGHNQIRKPTNTFTVKSLWNIQISDNKRFFSVFGKWHNVYVFKLIVAIRMQLRQKGWLAISMAGLQLEELELSCWIMGLPATGWANRWNYSYCSAKAAKKGNRTLKEHYFQYGE